MGANTYAKAGKRYPNGHWGKWHGVTCAECDKPAKCKGLCNSHYGKKKRAEGWRPPSVNPRSNRNRQLRYRYGIDLEDYERILSHQGGVCAVCGEPPTGKGRKDKLFVDHCHDTLKVRGLLCNTCNLAVGYGKSPDVLRKAADYLQGHAGHY